MNINATAYLSAYSEVFHRGEIIVPRGQECLEVCDYKLKLDMSHSVLTSFDARKLNLDYAKQEFLWYLRGDRFDTSIEQHATMWAKLQQADGGYNSNYGQYIFPNQFDFVVNELTNDAWSRRASIVLLNESHLYSANTDVVCTYGMNFRIRQGVLDMTVMMRSNDVIFGLTNDAFCFTMIYRMVLACLKGGPYPGLKPGTYTHIANSLHVYERHFRMIEDILDDGLPGYREIPMYWPSMSEVLDAFKLGRTAGLLETDNEFIKWLSAT